MPRIVIPLDTSETSSRGVAIPMAQIKAEYARAVERAGGIPLLVAPTDDARVIEEIGGFMSGLLLSGGAFDIEPELYGKSRFGARVNPPKPERTRFELALVKIALLRGVPVLGICGGMQLLNVALGGTLILDIPSTVTTTIQHDQETPATQPSHDVELVEGSRLFALNGGPKARVNSTHHQALERIADDLLVVGKSPDGIVEAVEHRSKKNVFGVQWHPERLEDAFSCAIYADFVSLAR